MAPIQSRLDVTAPDLTPGGQPAADADERITRWEEEIGSGRSLERADGLEILATPDAALFRLLAVADDVRRRSRGDSVTLCGIVNARSGLCSEDCAFCAQSNHHRGDAPVFGFVGSEAVEAAAGRARDSGVREFSIVASGRALKPGPEADRFAAAVAAVRAQGVTPCASLGMLGREVLEELRAAGLENYHHNLETSEGFYPSVCTTHTYRDKVETVKVAKELGFHVCSGGIFGLGESAADRVDLALTLRQLDVDSVPLNFLDSRPGTPLADVDPPSPRDCLRIIAMFRLLLPEKEIVVAGGRLRALGDLHPLVFAAGASGILTGDYLTTKGRDPADDLRLISQLGLEVRGDGRA